MKNSNCSILNLEEESGLQLLNGAQKLNIINSSSYSTFFESCKKQNQYIINNNIGKTIFYAVYAEKLEKKFYKFIGYHIMTLVDTLGNKIITLHRRYKHHWCSYEWIINVASKTGSLLASMRKDCDDFYTYHIVNSEKEIIYYLYIGRNGKEHTFTQPDGINEVAKILFTFPPACTQIIYSAKIDNTQKAILLGIALKVMNENVKALSQVQLLTFH